MYLKKQSRWPATSRNEAAEWIDGDPTEDREEWTSRSTAPDATTTLRTSEVQARRIEEQREGGRGREERSGFQRHVTQDVALWKRGRMVMNSANVLKNVFEGECRARGMESSSVGVPEEAGTRSRRKGCAISGPSR